MQALRHGNWAEALTRFDALCRESPTKWYPWYGTGQALRFLNRFEEAEERLRQAAHLAEFEPAVWLALGIARQLQGKLDAAKQALGRALTIDPDMAPAYNSLALTQKIGGELDKALHNYDAGTKAIARAFVKRMTNDRSNQIVAFRPTTGHIWAKCASFGALYHASMPEHPADTLAWPTGESAEEEERTHRHGGLMYIDHQTDKGIVRLFLPNYFNTFCASLVGNSTYYNLLANASEVFALKGERELADDYRSEAIEFGATLSPRDNRVTWR
jgi:tetratricopeptide (TPR) repeat protein